jgi:pimeloyl-ACP methyl ester carboxylesterase
VDTDRDAVLKAMNEEDRLVAHELIGARGPVVLLRTAVTIAVRIAVATLRRFVAGRDHGLHATIIEEILRAAWLADLGTWGWDAMKRTAQQMWEPPLAARPAAGSLLLERLVARGNLPPIDVVGHSAGSIAICHMVAALMQRYPTVSLRNVTLLAPACRHDLFAATLVPALAANRIRSLRMFTMSDEHERRDALVNQAPFLYPRSLLYLVSGIFEDVADAPLLGMQRFLSGADPFIGAGYDRVRAALPVAGLGWSPTAAAAPLGMRCAAVDHGTFDEDSSLRESLMEIVRA